jgi:mRNA interferase MazF
MESGRPAPGVALPIRRGDVFFADLSPVIGSEQGGVRPVVVIQNDIGNRYSPTVIVAAITSQRDKSRLPIHVALSASDSALGRPCLILLEQIRTIDKRRLRQRVAHLPDHVMARVDRAIAISVGLTRL